MAQITHGILTDAHRTERQPLYDVIVIGAGIVGTAIARELSRHALSILVVDAFADVGDGTSKANSAIIHTGFDAPPGSLESRLLRRSAPLWDAILADAPVVSVPTGAIMLAVTPEDEGRLGAVLDNARLNEVAVSPVTAAWVTERIPVVSSAVRAALFIPGERVVDPFSAVRFYGEHAAANGVQFVFDCRVTALEPDQGAVAVRTAEGTFRGRFVVNAGGLWGDALALALGDPIPLTPRKGQFLISEEDLGITSILLPVPTPTSKGILIAPIAFGGILLGPTAEDQEDKDDRATTAAGLEAVIEGTAKLVPAVRRLPSIRQFAGLRAVGPTKDYSIRWSAADPRILHVLGIRSTGISASPGIAAYVVELLAEHGLDLSPKPVWAAPPALLDQTEGDVVCLCRSVTRGEVLRALTGPLPARTLDGVKRRSGAILGDCQGNCCLPEVIELMAEVAGRPVTTIRKNGPGSEVVIEARGRGPARHAQGADAEWPHVVEVVVVGGGRTGGDVARRLKAGGVAVAAVDPTGIGGSWPGTVVGLGEVPGGFEVFVGARHDAPVVTARAVVLASGAYHVPREGARIPGTRPAGVLTPDLVRRATARGWHIGRRAVLVALTADVVDDVRAAAAAFATVSPIHVPDTLGLRGPEFVGVRRWVRVEGHPRFTGLVFEDAAGRVHTSVGDTLVLSGGKRAMAPYLKAGPAVEWHEGQVVTDGDGSTRVPGLFAVGSVAGRRSDPAAVAAAVARWLQGSPTGGVG